MSNDTSQRVAAQRRPAGQRIRLVVFRVLATIAGLFFLLAVNGRPVRSPGNVYEAFVGTVGKQTVLKLGSSASDSKPRTITVKPVASEAVTMRARTGRRWPWWLPTRRRHRRKSKTTCASD